MVFEKFDITDGAYSNLAVGLVAIDASLQFDTGEGARFKNGVCKQILTIVQYTIADDPTSPIVKFEKVLMTNRSGDTGAITRGYDGTTATSFNTWDRVYWNVVIKIITDIQDELTRINTDKLDIADYQNWLKVYAASSTGTDAYAITLSPAPSSYLTAQTFKFLADVWNTWAATLNVNWLGAKTIKKLRDQDLATGDIEAGQIVEVAYDGTNFQMNSQIANIPTIDINGLTEDTSPDIDNDFFIQYDASAFTNKKVKIARYRAADADANLGTSTALFVTPLHLKKYCGKIVAWNTFTVSAGTTWGSTASASYVKLFQWTIEVAGQYRVAFELSNGWGSGRTAFCRIYKNGAAFGTERNVSGTSGTYQGFSEDLTFAKNDTIEVWAYIAWAAWYNSSVQNFSMKYDLRADTTITMA